MTSTNPPIWAAPVIPAPPHPGWTRRRKIVVGSVTALIALMVIGAFAPKPESAETITVADNAAAPVDPVVVVPVATEAPTTTEPATTTTVALTTTIATTTTTVAPTTTITTTTTTTVAPTTTTEYVLTQAETDSIQTISLRITLNDYSISGEACELIYELDPALEETGWALSLNSFEKGYEESLNGASRELLHEWYDECFWNGTWSGW